MPAAAPSRLLAVCRLWLVVPGPKQPEPLGEIQAVAGVMAF